MPQRTNLVEVAPGQPITAEWANNIVRFLKTFNITGPYVTETADGWHIRRKLGAGGGFRWVIVRPPVVENDLTLEVEDAIPHPTEYATNGRWIAASEAPGAVGPFTTETMDVWPHREGKHYIEYAWDGATVLRETQILMAFEVNGVWYPHPDPPFVMRARPINDIQTPCTPQGLT